MPRSDILIIVSFVPTIFVVVVVVSFVHPTQFHHRFGGDDFGIF